MATVTPRGKYWRVRIRRGGLDLNRTFDTRQEALDWATQEEPHYVRGGPVEAAREKAVERSLKTVLQRYAEEVSPTNYGARWEILRIKTFIKNPIFKIDVADVKPSTLAMFRDMRLKEVEPSTVNRDLNLLSAIFTHAMQEWGAEFDKNPVSMIRRPKNPPPRTRRITDEERDLVVKQLGWSEDRAPEDIYEWIAFAFCLALETMMRQGEILSLRWGNVDEKAKTAYLPRTKNGQSRHVPLSTRALRLLGLLERREPQQKVVQTAQGTLGRYFREAVVGAGLDNLHFHDTRRESLTRFSEKLSVVELARASGHSDDLRTLMVYYRPNPSDIADKLG